MTTDDHGGQSAQGEGMDVSPDPTADAVAEAEQVRATERERLRALVQKDLLVADQLHADDFQLINPSGGVLSKEEYLSGIASRAIDYQVWEPDSPIAVRLYGPAALIRYRSRLDIIVDGSHVGLGNYWHTDLYERRHGQWQCVWSHATAIG